MISTKIEEKLELRMYSLVLYQLSGIQKGIQSGHSNSEFGVKYNLSPDYLDWKRNWKTVIILNGGSSISLTEHIQYLEEMGVSNSPFIEPDLYNQITSVSFLIDERVFDKKKYLDYEPFLSNILGKKVLERTKKKVKKTNSHLEDVFPIHFERWVQSLGGMKNVQLREWLKDFRLA